MNWNERLIYWVAILLLIIFLRECKAKTVTVSAKPVEIVKIDTFFVHDTVQVKSYVPALAKELTAPLIQLVPYYADYSYMDTSAKVAADAFDYKTVRYYSDSQHLEHGYIKIYDTVWQNRITGRSIQPFIIFPVITKTITVTDFEKPSTQLYLGIGAYGNKTVPINATGFSLLLKTKKDRMYEAGAFVDWQKQVWYYGSMKFKIRLKK